MNNVQWAHEAYFVFKFKCGEKWAVPVEPIARNWARQYIGNYDNYIDSYHGACELFRDDYDEIAVHAQQNMTWGMLRPFAEKFSDADIDFKNEFKSVAYEITDILGQDIK